MRPRSRNSARPFRILCLDGGGICGVFAAAVLRRWEQMTGREIVDHFDLIAGTSTGGILAIGLALGIKPADMERFYASQGATIFPIESRDRLNDPHPPPLVPLEVRLVRAEEGPRRRVR